MAGFLRRFTEIPTIEVIRQIESLVIVDLAPPDPATGAGSGSVLVVGEFEDGFFATDEASKGSVEVLGSEDFRTKFGGLGYTYNNVVANNPSARRHQGELWNGNGYLKAYKLRAQRIMVARVDTSVGSVSFDALACVGAGAGPWPLEAGMTWNITTDEGTQASDAVAAVAATAAGSGESFDTIASGDTFGVRFDGGVQQNIAFGAADTTVAAVVARINSTVGFTAAAENTGEVDISGIQLGTGGSVELIEVTAGVLAKLGHSAGSTAGTGNVANLNSVTAAEVASIINGTTGMDTIEAVAEVTAAGLRVCCSSPAADSTIAVATTTGATAVGFGPLDTTVAITDHEGGSIPAGTRVRAGLLEWVTMQTLDVPASAVGPFSVKVRPALDDGTAVGTALATVDTLVDPVPWAALVVNNPAALTAALTEPQMDNAYIAALNETLDMSGPAREANYLLMARRTDTLVREGSANATKATECGMFARKFVTGDPLGTTVSQGVANVANFRSDRVFYTSKGLKARIPAIAERGEAGGLGFTADGVITVRPDGPLTTICALLPPEENPGQQTNLLDDTFFEVDTFGERLTIDHYKAYKAAGIVAPMAHRISGIIFASGVTSSLVSGRTTMARRKMADFVQDSAEALLMPYVKKLARAQRRAKVRGIWEGFLGGLLAENKPEESRIEGFVVNDGADAGNTASNLALGLYYLKTVVKTHPSMDNIILQTEIGPNAVLSTQN